MGMLGKWTVWKVWRGPTHELLEVDFTDEDGVIHRFYPHTVANTIKIQKIKEYLESELEGVKTCGDISDSEFMAKTVLNMMETQ